MSPKAPESRLGEPTLRSEVCCQISLGLHALRCGTRSPRGYPPARDAFGTSSSGPPQHPLDAFAQCGPTLLDGFEPRTSRFGEPVDSRAAAIICHFPLRFDMPGFLQTMQGRIKGSF